MTSAKMQKMNRHNRPGRDGELHYGRKRVCCRCGKIMTDAEPMVQRGEFYHDRRTKPCPNDGKTFYVDDETKETSEFVRKRVRRAAKRLGRRVA